MMVRTSFSDADATSESALRVSTACTRRTP
jgi:hypothetical protein